MGRKTNKSQQRGPRTATGLIAQRITSAYRTVSKEAKLVLAGLTPLTLEALRRWKKYNGIDMARSEISILWQERWDIAQTGRHTHRILPEIYQWTRRTHGETDFYLTQVLTGIGLFNKYLHNIGQAPSDLCNLCITTDSVEHCILKCPE